jgi:hypothetical protein
MTAAAIATMATVEAATITAVSCPFACSRKRKRRAVRARVRARMAKPSQHHESAWSTTLHDHNPEAGRAALDQQAADLNPPWPLDELQRALPPQMGPPRASGQTSVKEQPESVEPAVHAIVSRCDATQDGFRALLSSPNLKRR